MHILHRQEETTGLPLDAWGRPVAARRVLWEIPGIVKVRIVEKYGSSKGAYCGKFRGSQVCVLWHCVKNGVSRKIGKRRFVQK